MKTIIRFCTVLIACGLLVGLMSVSAASAAATIDNSDLLPKYVSHDKVQLEGSTPDWADELILAQFRIETATEEGTLEAAVKVLDHYAEMGVNGLMILPVADRPLDTDGNGYNNRGPETIWSKITGTIDYEAGWKKFKTFVDEAHKRNLRVIVDIITWGVAVDSPVYKSNPGWFNVSQYTNCGYQYANCRWQYDGLIKYWSDALVDVAKKTGLDGYRCDCEPFTSGYTMYGIVRDRALAENNQPLLIMSETVGGRDDAAGYPVYDLEQWGGVTYHDRTQDGWGNRLMASRNTTFTEHYNIVDAIKTKGNPAIYNDGKDRLYVNMLSCHDNVEVVALGDRVYMGYQAIFAPFIPMWFIGEEWNNPDRCGGTGVLYFNEINWREKDKAENRAYFEDIKRMIRVRRQYPEVFAYFPDSVRDANICKVTTNRDDELQAYARWYGDTAVLIVPNTDDIRAQRKFEVTVPWEDMGMNEKASTKYVVIDAYKSKEIVSGTPAQIKKFSSNIASLSVGAFVVIPANKSTTAKPTTKTTTKTTAQSTAPEQGETTSSPVQGETTTVPSEGDTATTPAEGDTATTPVQGGTESTVTTVPTTEGNAPSDDAAALPVGLVVGIAAGVVVVVAAVVVLVALKKRVKV